MRAVTTVDNNLVVRDHPDPLPGAGEVLVEVRAAGINGADLIQLEGFYPAPPGSPPDIPAWSWRAKSSRWGRRIAVHGRRPGHGPGRRRWSGGARDSPREPPHEHPRHRGLDRGRRLRRGVHHGPRRSLHPGRASQRRARPHQRRRRWRRRRRRPAGAPRRCARLRDGACRASCAPRWPSSAPTWSPAPDGVAAHGPFDVILELVGAPNLAANVEALAVRGAHRGHRHRGRARARDRPAHPDEHGAAG